MKNLLFNLLLLVFVLPNLGNGQNTSLPIVPLEANDIWAKTLENKDFSEFWNYQIHLDNGMKIYITYSVSNIVKFSGSVSGIQVSLLGLRGKNYELNREYPLKNLLQDSSIYLFDINPRQKNIWFKGKLPEFHEIYINTDRTGDRFKIHLTFENIQKGYKVNNGQFEINEEEIGILTHIPYAEVKGYAGIDNDTIMVRGTAYMDHLWQYNKASKLFSSGFRFIHHKNSTDWDISLSLSYYKKDEHQSIGYRIINKNEQFEVLPLNVSKESIRYMDEKKDFPEELILSKLDNSKWIIAKTKKFGQRSILDDLNWFKRVAVRRLIGGELTDYRYRGILKDDSLSIEGNFDYFIFK